MELNHEVQYNQIAAAYTLFRVLLTSMAHAYRATGA